MQATTTSMSSSCDGMIGVSTEAGGKVFDPLGLAELHKINPLVNPHPKVCEPWFGRFCACLAASMYIVVAQALLFRSGGGRSQARESRLKMFVRVTACGPQAPV